jgi:hypothetical protein
MPAFNNQDLINSTIAKWVRDGQFVDNISYRVPLFNWMRKGKAFKFWDGAGTKIYEPVIKTLQTGNTQSMDPYEQLVLTPSNNTELVPFSRKVIRFPVVISNEEMEQNSGREKIIDLVKNKMKVAEISLATDLETMLFADGTGNGGKDLLGLAAIIPTTSNAGTFAGFDRSVAANAWIKCPTATGAKTATAFDNLRKKMSNLTNTLTYGTVRPTLYMTDQATYEGYEDLCYGKYLPTDKSGAVDLGFSGDLVFRGQPVVFADKIAAGDMYLLNADSLAMRIKGLKAADASPFTVMGPYDLMPWQAAKAWVIEISGALTVNMFRQIGKLYSCS